MIHRSNKLSIIFIGMCLMMVMGQMPAVEVPPLGQVGSASNPNQGEQVKAAPDGSDHAVHWWKDNWLTLDLHKRAKRGTITAKTKSKRIL